MQLGLGVQGLGFRAYGLGFRVLFKELGFGGFNEYTYGWPAWKDLKKTSHELCTNIQVNSNSQIPIPLLP